MELIEFMEMDEEILNEAVDIKGALKKANVFSKDNDGLLATIARAGKTMGLFVWHALKAFGGDDKSADELKKLANTKITKQDFINFLINLDMVTLHAISGPIHAIEAITGWPVHHALTKVHTKTKDMTKKVLDALDNVQNATNQLPSKVKKKASSFIRKLRNTFRPPRKVTS